MHADNTLVELVSAFGLAMECALDLFLDNAYGERPTIARRELLVDRLNGHSVAHVVIEQGGEYLTHARYFGDEEGWRELS
jgi:protein-disulfide isomerase-like protein with CxxC motif